VLILSIHERILFVIRVGREGDDNLYLSPAPALKYPNDK